MLGYGGGLLRRSLAVARAKLEHLRRRGDGERRLSPNRRGPRLPGRCPCSMAAARRKPFLIIRPPREARRAISSRADLCSRFTLLWFRALPVAARNIHGSEISRIAAPGAGSRRCRPPERWAQGSVAPNTMKLAGDRAGRHHDQQTHRLRSRNGRSAVPAFVNGANRHGASSGRLNGL